MNPYELIIANSSAKKNVSSRTSNPAPSQPSGVLSRATKHKKIQKPRIRLSVEHRYQFDLPEPPMDLMMLNGTMAPDAFGKAQSVPIERLARPRALPIDPRYGCFAGLIDTSPYRKPVKLTIEDEALLLTIESESKTGMSATGSTLPSKTGDSTPGVPPTRRRLVAPAPWMRRMSYDEYFGRSSPHPRSAPVSALQKGLTPLGRTPTRMKKAPLKPKATIQRSFMLAGKIPPHPDKRKRHLKAVKTIPLFPDFSTLGTEFISMQFDRNMNLTHPARNKDKEVYNKAAMNMATISLAGEDNKKFLASYTPSDAALGQINEGVNEDENDESTLVYEWVSEYGIVDPSKYGLTGLRKDQDKRFARQIYALRKFTHPDGKRQVATLSKVAVSWRLNQRRKPLPQLGKPHLKIEKVAYTKEDKDERQARTLALFGKK